MKLFLLGLVLTAILAAFLIVLAVFAIWNIPYPDIVNKIALTVTLAWLIVGILFLIIKL